MQCAVVELTKSGILGVQVATGAVEGGGTAGGSSSNSKSLSSVYKDPAKASAAMLCSLSDA